MLTMPVMAGNVREEKTSLTNPENVRTGKRKKDYAGHSSDRPTGDKTFLVHGPGHSAEECKVLKEYSSKYATQRNHKESHSSSKKKRGKSVNFNKETQEVNSMEINYKPAPKK